MATLGVINTSTKGDKSANNGFGAPGRTEASIKILHSGQGFLVFEHNPSTAHHDKMIASASASYDHEGHDTIQGQSLIGFLSLPRELRDEVYRIAFIEQEPIYLCLANSSQSTKPCGPGPQSLVKQSAYNLARTCHQLRNEVQEIFFTRNRFRVYYSSYTPVRERLHHNCSCPWMLRHAKALIVDNECWPDSALRIRPSDGKIVVELDLATRPPSHHRMLRFFPAPDLHKRTSWSRQIHLDDILVGACIDKKMLKALEHIMLGEGPPWTKRNHAIAFGERMLLEAEKLGWSNK